MVLRRTQPLITASGSVADACTAHPLVIRQLIVEVSRAGLDGNGLCRGLGFGADDVYEPDFLVSYAQTREVLLRAMPMLARPHLGLYLGENLNVVSWGASLLALMAAADSHQMLELAVRHLPSIGPFLHMDLQRGPVQLSMFAEDVYGDPEISPFLVEHMFASLSRVGRFVVAPSYRPIAVEFTHARPRGANGSFARVFDCPVSFQQARNRLVYAARSEAISTADEVVAKQCERLRVQHHTGPDARSQVERVVARALRGSLQAPPSMRTIAESLHISERTLRRRLHDAGLTYAGLLDGERRRSALALMSDGTQSLGRVADTCGFADVRSLRRALKRWTGLTPSQVRLGQA